MIFDNVLAWSAQIAALVAVGAITSAVLRLRTPGTRLFYWQMLLVAALVLPLVRPWKHELATADVSFSTVLIAQHAGPAARHLPSFREAALWVLAAGIVVRALWLAAGLWRLSRYRRRSRPFGFRYGAALLVSDAITSPVTFGVLRPVVLLPPQFPELEAQVREAILSHELQHVRRRDWLFLLGEELVRAVFWFHPAIWWLLSEIGLAREQEVDRQAVAETRLREEYVDALLAFAGAGTHLDLAPASSFLRKRHLKQRVVSILKEVRMSKTQLFSSMAAALVILAAAGWIVTAAFPLSAAPDVVADSPGVAVDIGGAALLHRAPVVYPEAAREQGVQGTVVLQAAVDARGNVTDAQVLSGPDELRKAALQSVLNWHFTPDPAVRTRQVSITFQPGFAQAPLAPGQAASENTAKARPLNQSPRTLQSVTISAINVVGLSDQARADLLARLPIHPGDTVEVARYAELNQIVRQFDSHLLIVPGTNAAGEAVITVATPDALPPSARIRVGGNVQSTKLIKQPRPNYPIEAKQARIQGVVKLYGLIGRDGTIQNLNVISGHPLLSAAALEAVKQWVYHPTLLNGNPVEVETEIDVNFTLAQ
jgi:TonB family protein